MHHINPGILSRHVPPWVNVSYVCRYWRDVALDCPTLWICQFVVSQRCTEELLARSKQTSLKIHFEAEYGKFDTWWLAPTEELMKHAKRFEDLVLHDSNDYHVLSMLSAHAPCLQNLQISAQGFQSEQHFFPFQGDTPYTLSFRVSNALVLLQAQFFDNPRSLLGPAKHSRLPGHAEMYARPHRTVSR